MNELVTPSKQPLLERCSTVFKPALIKGAVVSPKEKEKLLLM